jgi:fructose-specific phosphotransferase system IIC component
MGMSALSPSTYKNAAGKAVQAFKDNASFIYRILYTLAFTLILSILIFPSLAFFVIGILCYFLLQKKINTIKKL